MVMFKGLRTFLKIQGALATLAATRLGVDLAGPLSNAIGHALYPPSPVAQPVPAGLPPSPVAQAVTPPSYGGGGGARSNPIYPHVPAPAGLPPAPPPMSLADSPSFQAFMRQIALEQSQAKSATQDRVDALNRELARQIPDVQQAGEFTRQGISGNMESRGLYLSGELEQALAHQQQAQAQQISDLQGGVGDQVTILNNDLARKVADLQRQQADAALTAAGQVFTG